MSINLQDWTMGKIGSLSAIALWTMVSSASVLANPVQPMDSPTQQIIGRWEGTHSSRTRTQSAVVRFTPTGKLIMVISDFQKGGLVVSLDYTIDATKQPMHLNVSGAILPRPAVVSAELSNAQTLKLQWQPERTNSKNLGDVFELQKVSETEVLPLTPSRLVPLEASQEGEGKFVMTALVRSALIQTIERQKLPTKLDELGLNRASTRNYNLQLIAQPGQLTLIARAKKTGLRSYIGTVLPQSLAVRGGTVNSGLGAICQSVRPSSIAPPTPKVTGPKPILSRTFPLVVCGSGSELVGF